MDIHFFIGRILVHTSNIESGKDIGGAELAEVLQILATLEVEEGGPYATKPGGAITSADIGFNLAIARFLSTNGVHLSKLDAFIENSLSQGKHSSSVMGDDVLKELIVWHNTRTKEESGGMAKSTNSFSKSEEQLMSLIRDHAKTRLKDLPDEFVQSANSSIERTIKSNPDKQMSLMANYVREALGKKGDIFTDDHIAKLGLANIFFWTAFIIYDDFWDEDEEADPRLLPVANLFARHYVDLFTTLLPLESDFREFFHKTMDDLDAANEWETNHCRMRVQTNNACVVPDELPAYGDYDIKFHPAGGHVLGPVAMLIELGYNVNSKEVKALIDYFKHYLIAMQLNDDAHDWKEDLERGHISTAVYVLLQKWKEKHPDRKRIYFVNDMPELEQMFWFEVLTPICESILSRTSRSREALKSLSFLDNIAPLEYFITRNENLAKEALSERKKSEDFLQAFSSQTHRVNERHADAL